MLIITRSENEQSCDARIISRPPYPLTKHDLLLQETRFLVEPTNKTVRSGEDVTLECKVASMTRPSIIWLKEVQQILGQTQPDMIDLGEKRFKVKFVQILPDLITKTLYPATKIPKFSTYFRS